MHSSGLFELLIGIQALAGIGAFIQGLFTSDSRKRPVSLVVGLAFLLAACYLFANRERLSRRDNAVGKGSEPGSQVTSTKRDEGGGVSAQHSQPVPPPTPRPRPEPPKALITRAGEPITVGDFTFVMDRCGNGENWLRCAGKVVNRGDSRLSLSFTGGTATDDVGNQYALTTFLGGSMAGLVFGTADSSSAELTPGVPAKFGFVLKWKSNATAFNLDLRFSTSGQPATSQITFTNIPVLE
jgi:hypothetical protein